MDKVKIAKIKVAQTRPVSWNIYVQGKNEAEHIRTLLAEEGIHTSPLQPHPNPTQPSIFRLPVTLGEAAAMTIDELEAILTQDKRVELEFEEV